MAQNLHKIMSPKSKPWWSSLLTSLSREHYSRSRAHKKHPLPDSALVARTAKQAYFNVIRSAKNSYGKAFLAGADDKSVWKASVTTLRLGSYRG